MARNESMLLAASYFYQTPSTMHNAFLFGHGPATLTLADVLMLAGLNITAPDSAVFWPRLHIGWRRRMTVVGKAISITQLFQTCA
jgi:hypothetical protein